MKGTLCGNSQFIYTLTWDVEPLTGRSPPPSFSHPLAYSGFQGLAAELSWKPGLGRLEGQTSCLREDVSGGSKCDKKM